MVAILLRWYGRDLADGVEDAISRASSLKVADIELVAQRCKGCGISARTWRIECRSPRNRLNPDSIVTRDDGPSARTVTPRRGLPEAPPWRHSRDFRLMAVSIQCANPTRL